MSLGLDNDGSDNRACCVEIASVIGCRTTGRHVKTYLIKFSDHEEGPYAETQVAQMFADGRMRSKHTM